MQNSIETPAPKQTQTPEAQGSLPAARNAPGLFDIRAVNETWDRIPQSRENARLTKEGAPSLHLDMLSTRLRLHMRQKGWRSLAITSPTSGCGKSSLALQIALSLSDQPDMRAILLDFDFRKPALGRMIGIDQPFEFETVLRGDEEFVDVACRLRGNLCFAGNKTSASCPQDVVQGRLMPLTLSLIQDQLRPDVMILDTPPLLESPDFLAIAPHVDCVLLVAEADRTTITEIDQCEREIASQTNMLGVVLNKCRHLEAKRGYYS